MTAVMKMLTMLDIRQEGDAILRKRAEEVPIPLSAETVATLGSMMEYILNSQDDALAAEYGLRAAVGLAAPQIGVSRRMFCMNTYDEKGETLFRFCVVNPKIVSSSEELCYLPGGEGCLSVAEEKNGLVPRAKRIKAKALLFDPATGKVEDVLLRLQGYPAIVFQHEYDHLQGILFVDRKKAELPGIKPIEFPAPEEPEL